jgi:hypothetical protein
MRNKALDGHAACRLLRQCVPPALCGAVPVPVSHTYRCSGPPRRTHWFRLDQGRAAALAIARGSSLGMRVQLWALFLQDGVLILIVCY